MHHGQLDKQYLIMCKLGVTVKFAIVSALMGCVHIMYLQMMLRPPSKGVMQELEVWWARGGG